MTNEAPFRCTSCGGLTQAVVHSPHGSHLDAAFTQVDERYATAWCYWCKRTREAVRAATVAEATGPTHEQHRQRRRATGPPDQLKGGW